jgi:hypothetical protein
VGEGDRQTYADQFIKNKMKIKYDGKNIFLNTISWDNTDTWAVTSKYKKFYSHRVTLRKTICDLLVESNGVSISERILFVS